MFGHFAMMSWSLGSARTVAPLALVALWLSLWPSHARAQAATPAASSACGTDNLLAGKAPANTQDLLGNAALVTDGAVAQDGAQWDAPVAVILTTGEGWISYDLGQLRQVSAIHVQGDANDSYKVSGSPEGAPGSWKPVVEIENVVARGHGLRTRAVQFAPVTVRFLRLGEGRGDGSYSISEFAAYCQASTPFPPPMRIADAPQAKVVPLAPNTLAGTDESSAPRLPFLIAAALLALVGSGLAAARRTSASAATPLTADASTAAATPEAAAAPQLVSPSRVHDVLRILFVASGCAALIYEVIWFHLLRLVIGASALSVGIVLASFMGGMFLGSLLFARLVSRTRNPLRVYATIEIGIGAFGLLMPLVLPAVRFIYVGLVGYGGLGIALRALIAAVLLLPPTALMGATLPAIARRYSHGRRGMSQLASLYVANTVGAVMGCLLAAFYLLSVWDIWVATAVAAALNFAIGWYALRLSRSAASEAEPAAAPVASATTEPAAEPYAVYLAIGLSGLTALGAQVVWTRLLTLLFGATIYAFAIILAVFLAGLGLGSIAASYLLRRSASPVHGLAWSQVALVPAVLLAGWLLATVLPYAAPASMTPVRALHALHVLRAMVVILPGAALWGMSFPFALAAAGRSHGDPGRSSGRVYAANTIGAIIGALGVSFWAVPAWGTRWAQQILVLGAAVSAAALFHAIRRAPERFTPGGRRLRSLPPTWALAAGALAAALLPGLSKVFQTHARYIWWVDPQDQYLYVTEGAASTVAVHVGANGTRSFHVSGRVEASNNNNDMRLQRLLGHLSVLAHPHPESVLVVGLGAGVTAGALTLHPEVKRIVICEIEPRVVGATRLFATENYSVLSDPRVQVVFDDARHFLATTRERFDVITSDPIHPWVRGNSVLFSREYYEIVRSRLRPGGIATQWVPLYETSEEAIRIQMRTFTDGFPNGTVWNSHVSGKGYDVVLLGHDTPLRLDLTSIQRRIDGSPRIKESLSEVKIGGVVDLMATYATSGPEMQGWLAGAPVNRDFSLKLEYISGMALNQREADPIYEHMVAARAYPESLFAATPEMHADLRRRLPDPGAKPPR